MNERHLLIANIFLGTEYKSFEEFEINNIIKILKVEENYIHHFDLDGDKWDLLLRELPQFHIHCDWKKLDGIDWSCLLKIQPQFKKYKDKYYE
jgi:hypothetical protein